MAGGILIQLWYRMLFTSSVMILMMLSIDIFESVESKVVNRFADTSGSLRTMVYDRRRQRLYIGDTNSVHALSATDFSRVGVLLLGPMDDSLDCPFDTRESCPPGVSRVSTDNINQVLIYDEDDDVLIACGTLFYGSCERINLDTLTHDLGLPHRPTVPNDPASSVVAFFVPRSRVTYDFGVVYVGASYSFIGSSSSQNNIHMLSSRQASTLNYLPGAASFIDVLSSYRSTFLVEFITAFEHEGFAYFLITRKETFSTTQRRTFLLRFCLNDASMRSLVELKLECDVSGSIYGRLRAGYKALVGKRLMADVLGDTQSASSWALYGLFTVDQADSPTPRGASAICVFPMKIIEQAVQRVTASCFSGTGFKGPTYIATGTPCTRKDVHIPSDYCGSYDMNYPLSDASPVRPTYSLALPSITGLSLLISTANDYTIASVGTVDGRVIQMVLRSRMNSLPAVYRETVLDVSTNLAHASVKQLLFGLRDSIDSIYPHFFARTDKVVYRVEMFDCDSRKTCSECIVDPHCGWCASANKCTRKSSCSQISFWLGERCPILTSLDPTLVSRDSYTTTKFTVTLSFIPADRRYVWCAMEEARTAEDKGVGSVEKILAKSDPSIAPGLDGQTTYTCGPFRDLPVDSGVVVNMTLKIIVDVAEWASGTVSIYNCARLSLCSACSVSAYPCKWCIERHTCLRDTQDCTLPNGNSGTILSDASNCPSIEVRDNRTLLVADGTSVTGFSIVAYNMMEYFRDTLQCKFRMVGEGKVLRSSARYSSSSTLIRQIDVTCDPVVLTYSGSTPYDVAEFDLVWGNDLALDNPNNLSVRVYKCRHLVNNCGQCLTLKEGYECGWCRRDRGGESICTPVGDCSNGGMWMNRQEICLNPRITSIQPLGGPVLGGTMLTINGVNLGKLPSDLEIAVAGRLCTVQTKGYIPSQRVVCATTGADKEVKGPVIVTVSSRYVTPVADNVLYHYKDPVLGFGTLKPLSGPISGGTVVSFQGRNLDYGSSCNILVNGLHSNIITRTSDMVVFKTPRVSLKGDVQIKISFDGPAEYPLNERFRYVADPTVTRTEPAFSLFSGGTTVDVIGTGLNAVQKPLMILHYSTSANKTTPCKIKSSSILECPTPNLSGVGLGSEQKVDIPVGWIMDNVTGLVYIKIGNWVRSLTYHLDPEINVLTKPFAYTEEQQMLEIKGNNMELLKQFKELQVQVGGAQCWIDNIRDVPDVLRCRMPEPDDDKELNKEGLARVVVMLGNYRREIGYVSYKSDKPNVPLILGLVLGLLLPLLIFAGIVAFIFLRRKRRKRRTTGRKPGPPSGLLLEMDSRRGAASRQSNSYTEAAGNQTGTPPGGNAADESVPLRRAEEEFRDDDIIAKDDEKYFRELLKRISNPKVRDAAKEVFIHRERLEIGNLLGKGHFGRVYAATLRDALLKNPHQVAVKTIEDSEPNHQLMENFLQEGIVMKNFNHPHVLGLIGMCLGYKKEPMVILPFMANGDLRTYVKDKRKSFTARQLLLLAQQVAEGMAYLSSLNYIHRDLAARNCMIDDRNEVKVADFGLSHQLYDKEYYSSKDPKSKLPIKWMALESLEEFVFTIKSDVWSFGVLMWELMTRGVTPYPDVEVFETRNYLASGRRLRKPKYCPDNVYSIMSDCWHGVPENRPSFSELVNRLEFLLNPTKPGQVGGAQGGGSSSEPMYINMAEPSDNQDYLKPINPDSSFAPTESSFSPEA